MTGTNLPEFSFDIPRGELVRAKTTEYSMWVTGKLLDDPVPPGEARVIRDPRGEDWEVRANQVRRATSEERDIFATEERQHP